MISYEIHKNSNHRERYDLAPVFTHMLEKIAFHQFFKGLISLIRVSFWSLLSKRSLRVYICVASFWFISLWVYSVIIVWIFRLLGGYFLEIRINAFLIGSVNKGFVGFLGECLWGILIVVQKCLKLEWLDQIFGEITFFLTTHFKNPLEDVLELMP